MDVLPERIAIDDFNIGEKSENKTSQSAIVANLYIEFPMGVVGHYYILCPLWVLLNEKIVCQLPHQQSDPVAFLATEHEYVGEYLPMLVLMNPRGVQNFDAIHAIDAVSLVHTRLNFMTPHVLMVVHQVEGFHDSISHGLTVRARIADEAHHSFGCDGPADGFYYIIKVSPRRTIHLKREIVGMVYLVSKLVDCLICVSCHEQQTVDGAHLRIGEL